MTKIVIGIIFLLFAWVVPDQRPSDWYFDIALTAAAIINIVWGIKERITAQ